MMFLLYLILVWASYSLMMKVGKQDFKYIDNGCRVAIIAISLIPIWQICAIVMCLCRLAFIRYGSGVNKWLSKDYWREGE